MTRLPTHPTLRHPLTGEPLRALGFGRRGPIWPVLGGDGTDPAPAPNPAPTPAPAPAPAPLLPPAPPTPNPPTPGPSPFSAPPPLGQPPAAGQPGPSPATGTDPAGFPANTPWRDMKSGEQIAYWQHAARKHEDRVRAMSDYDQLKKTAEEHQKLVAASQTDHERAVAEARRQGHASALAETGGQLVEQWLRAAAAGRIHEENVNALLAGVDRSRFLNPGGGVDTDKVYAFVNSIVPAAPAQAVPPGDGLPGQQPVPPPVQAPQVPAPPRSPDFGQGTPGTARPSGLAAGREIAQKRFAANTTKT